jgi:phosphatidylglycerophosphate synthase
VTPSIVVLGAGPVPAADLLPSAPAARACSAVELREALASLAGNVLLVDPGVDFSARFPLDDVWMSGRTAVVVGSGGTAPVRVHSGSVVGAGTSEAPLVRSDVSAAGCLHIAEADRPELTGAVEGLSDAPPGLLWEQLLAVLVMRAVPVRAVDAAPFTIGGPRDSPRDARRLQARRCARSGDGWLSERTVRRVSPLITPWAVRWGITPNAVTGVSLLAGTGAVAAATGGTRGWYAVTAALMVVSLVLDCVDGEVARWTHRYSRAGAWLDAVGDRVKEYAVWFAVAAGAAQEELWLLVLTSLVFFTVKHFLDYGWSLRQPPWEPLPVPVGPGPDPWAVSGLVPAPTRPPSWRRILGLPIAERWLLLIVLLPTAGAMGAFWTLVLAGGLSLAYTVATRIRWSHDAISDLTRPALHVLTDPGPVLMAVRPRRHRWAAAAAVGALVLPVAAGVGQLGILVGGYAVAVALFAASYGPGPAGRLGWMAPAVSRAAEMTGMLAVATGVGSAAWSTVFALLAAAAWRHYDVIYRIRHQGRLPGSAARLLLGADGRVGAALLVAVTAGVGAWWWVALYIAVVSVGDSLNSWFGPGRPDD